MSTTKWVKAYKGPFAKEEAKKVAEELREKADPNKNGIYDARVRVRRKGNCVCTAACGAGLGHNEKYDVYIKTTK